MSNTNKIIIIFSLFLYFFILMTIRKYITFFSEQDINLVAIAGTLASFIGLLVVIVQIVSVRRISVITKETVDKTKENILSFYFVTDLSKATKTILEIQKYNREKKWELSMRGMYELKQSLMGIKNTPQFLKLVNVQRYKLHLRDLSTDINIVETEIQEKGDNLDSVQLNNHLDAIYNSIVDLETKIKGEGGWH